MVIKYDAQISNDAIVSRLKKITNQIYKLLPSREEGADWQKPLVTIQEELAGMDLLLIRYHEILFQLMCKLEGLLLLTDEDQFFVYRKTIFESLALTKELVDKICQDQND